LSVGAKYWLCVGAPVEGRAEAVRVRCDDVAVLVGNWTAVATDWAIIATARRMAPTVCQSADFSLGEAKNPPLTGASVSERVQRRIVAKLSCISIS